MSSRDKKDEVNIHPCWLEQVKHLPLQKSLTCLETETMENAILMMQEQSRGCVLVLNPKQELVGIMTERDVMFHFIGTTMPNRTEVREAMTPNVVTIRPEGSVAEAIALFGQKRFRHLPVCDGHNIVGVLSVRVLVDFIAENIPEEVLNLPPNLGEIPQVPFGA